MRIFRKLPPYLLVFSAVVLLWAINTVLFDSNTTEPLPSTTQPAESHFSNKIAGSGLVETRNENSELGTTTPGIVTALYVKAGMQVKAGDPLFTIDDRATRAARDVAIAEVESAKVNLADAEYRQSLAENIRNKQYAITKEDLQRRRFAAQLAASQLMVARAKLYSLQTDLDRLTVRAPSDGQILRINIRVGEYAAAGALRDPLLVLGDTSAWHVRVQIDETDALRLDATGKALGTLRGYPEKQVDLKFIRVEPLIIPKRSLTGDPNERVDTRVMEAIYVFDNKNIQARIGQQMDVFIEAIPRTSVATGE